MTVERSEHGRDGRDPWVVLYRKATTPPFNPPEAFACRAVDGDHAESQCRDAHPDSEVLWTMLGDVEDAYRDYWRGTGDSEPVSNTKRYLTVWRHTMDDVPIRLHDNYRDAEQDAMNIPTSTGYKIAGKLGIDCSTPVCWCVYHFDEHGRPCDVTFVIDHASREVSDNDMTGRV